MQDHENCAPTDQKDLADHLTDWKNKKHKEKQGTV